MKKLSIATLLALSTLASVPMTTIAATTTASSQSTTGKTVNVKFARGASAANYAGKITGTKYDVYKFVAKKGQKLKVKTSGGNVDTYLFHKSLADSVNVGQYSPEVDGNGAYTLPYSGTYELRVLQPRSQANQGKQPKYNLQIAIR